MINDRRRFFYVFHVIGVVDGDLDRAVRACGGAPAASHAVIQMNVNAVLDDDAIENAGSQTKIFLLTNVSAANPRLF